MGLECRGGTGMRQSLAGQGRAQPSSAGHPFLGLGFLKGRNGAGSKNLKSIHVPKRREARYL